ncbi:MAG: twin-arginine translocation signal domain-containing protein, partial [Alphaproteobacteria bacterium]
MVTIVTRRPARAPVAESQGLSRRDLLKRAGAAGLGAILVI